MSRDTFHAVEIVEWQTVKITDDFTETLSANKWTTTAPISGSAAEGDGPDGVLTILPSDASVGNNEDAYVYSRQAGVPRHGRRRHGQSRSMPGPRCSSSKPGSTTPAT